MNDLEQAIHRLTAWVRENRDGVPLWVTSDLTHVLAYAREKRIEDEEIDRIVESVVTRAPKDPKTTPIGQLRAALGMDGGSIGEVLDRAIKAIEASSKGET